MFHPVLKGSGYAYCVLQFVNFQSTAMQASITQLIRFPCAAHLQTVAYSNAVLGACHA